MLGWQREACAAEEPLDGTYTDYSLGFPAARVIVEAKKEGSTSLSPPARALSLFHFQGLRTGIQDSRMP